MRAGTVSILLTMICLFLKICFMQSRHATNISELSSYFLPHPNGQCPIFQGSQEPGGQHKCLISCCPCPHFTWPHGIYKDHQVIKDLQHCHPQSNHSTFSPFLLSGNVICNLNVSEYSLSLFAFVLLAKEMEFSWAFNLYLFEDH